MEERKMAKHCNRNSWVHVVVLKRPKLRKIPYN